jgi:hypothetical protein
VIATPDRVCGTTVVFTRTDGAPPLLPDNLDCITPDVCIARGYFQGLFNSASESYFSGSTSPAGTEWAYGTSAGIGNLDFEPWARAVDWYPPGMIGENIVLHLISDDLYYDVLFTSWTVGGGGGFSYRRTFPCFTHLPLIMKGH